MASLQKPANYSVHELEDALSDIDEPTTLTALLEAEQNGKDRKTAKEAINQRLAELDPDPPSDGQAAEADPSPDDTPSDTDPDDPNSSEDDANAGDPVSRPVDDDAAALGTIDLAAKQAEVLEGLDLEADFNYRLLEDLDDIRSALDDASTYDGRFEAQIRYLQSEVSDLKSYTMALEEFLDEEGTGRRVIESVQSELEHIENEISDIRANVAGHGRNLAELWGVLADVDGELEDLEGRLARQRDDLAARTEEVEAAVETVDETVDGHTAELENVHGTVTTLRERIGSVDEVVSNLEATVGDEFADAADHREDLARALEDHDGELEELSGTMDEMDATIEALERQLGESGRVDQRFDALEREVEALQEWRNQLGSVLSGSAEPAPEQ